MHELNSIIILDKNGKADKVVFVVKLWRETEKVKRYTDETLNSITAQIWDFCI